MTDLRTAAQQALEVLEDLDSPVALPAIIALRSALAQEQTKQACCTYPDCRCPIDKSTVCAKGLPEQAEPVAYWHKRGQEDEEFIHAEAVNDHCPDCEPLYLIPPQRKPLTDEEIDAEWQKASECAYSSEAVVTTSQFVRLFARAIERAHGINHSKPE